MVSVKPGPEQEVLRKLRKRGLDRLRHYQKMANRKRPAESEPPEEKQQEEKQQEEQPEGSAGGWAVSHHDMTVLRLRAALMVLKNERAKVKTDMEVMRKAIVERDATIMNLTATIEGLRDRLGTITSECEGKIRRVYGAMAENPAGIIPPMQW